MQNDNGKIYYGIGLDNSGLRQDAAESKRILHDIGGTAEKEGQKMDSTFKNLGKTVAATFGIAQLTMFVQKMVSVRSEIESLQKSFEILAGKKEGAKLFEDIKDFSIRTPMQLGDLAKGAQTLLAFNIEAEKVMPTLKAIGDISMGDAQKFDSLILAFSQMSSTGKLMGQDLLQMINAGFNPLGVIAEQTGKSIGELKKEMESGALSAEVITKAFMDASTEGGKFHGMLEAQSRTIRGALSNLQDNFNNMLNDLGTESQGFIMGAIGGVSKLIDNYDKLGKVLAGIIAAFGSYKAAMLAINVLGKTRKIQLLDNIRLTMMCRKEMGLMTAAQQAFNVASKANIYVALASAVIGVVTALSTFNKKQEEAIRNTGEASLKIRQETDDLERLFAVARDENEVKEKRAEAIETINARYGDYLDSLLTEKDSVEKLSEAYRGLTQAVTGKYLEQMKAQMVGDKQTALHDAESSMWGQLAKALANSGMTNEQQGRMTADIQTWIGKYAKQHSASDIYEKIAQTYKKYTGDDLQGKTSGSIYRSITDFKEAQENLSGAQKAFDDFADGYSDTMKKTGEQSQDTAEETRRSTAQIVRDIIEAEKHISELQKKAGAEGLTKDEEKDLGAWRKTADERRKEYKAFTGGEFGAGKSGADTEIEQFYEEFGKKMSRAAVKAQMDATDSEIAAMEEGYAKKKAQAEQQARKQEQDLIWQYEDQLKDIEEQERKLYMERHGGSDSGFVFDELENEAAKKLRKQFQDDLTNLAIETGISLDAIDKEHNDKLLASEREYMKEYGNLQQKKLAVTQEFQEKIREAEQEGDTYRAETLRNQMQEALTGLEKEYGTLFSLIFADAKALTETQLEKAIALTQQEIDKAEQSGNIEHLTELYARLKEQIGVQNDRDSGWGFSAIAEGIKKVQEAQEEYQTALDSGDKEAQAMAVWKQGQGQEQITEGIRQITSAFKDLGGAMQEIGGPIGEIGAALEDVSGRFSEMGDALVSKDKAGLISAAISNISDLISMVARQITENRKAQEEWNQSIRQAAHEYAMLKLEELEYEESNIFGVESPYKKAIDGVERYSAAVTGLIQLEKDLGDVEVQTGTKKVISGKNVAGGLGAGAAAGAAIGTTIIPGLGTAIGAAIGAAIGGITGALSRKTVPVFEKLRDRYGELFDAETFALNPRLLADYEAGLIKVDAETGNLIEHWEDFREVALQAQEDMRETFRTLAGDVGDNLADALVNAFRNKDLDAAMEDFHDSMTGTIEDIIGQLVFAAAFEDLFKDLQDEMEKSMGIGGDMNIVDDLMRFEQRIGKSREEYFRNMEEVQKWAAENGYELWKDRDRGAGARKGIATASQDSVDELNGRATAIQGHTFEIAENSRHLLMVTNQILASVMNIDSNTGDIGDRVENISASVKEMREALGEMAARGIKIR